jgi:hypothetical protein
MSFPLGALVARVDDGRAGKVELVGGETRITYFDRGERIVAGKQEVWALTDGRIPPLRDEEIVEVAFEADRALRAIEKHEPSRWWQPVNTKARPYDPGLVETIVSYLRARQQR